MPNPLLFVYRNFEFFALVLSLVNGYFVRKKAPTAALYPFVVFNSLWLVGGILHILGGYSTFYHVMLSPLTNIYTLLFWAYYFVCLWGLTAWALFGAGASLIAQTRIVRGPCMDKPLGIKIFFSLGSMIAPIVFVLGQTTGWFAAMLAGIEQIGSS